MRTTAARWGSMQSRVLAEATLREVERVVRDLAGAPDMLLDRARLLAADARAVADAARHLQHAVEALGNDDHAA
jgi:hypothetical protein